MSAPLDITALRKDRFAYWSKAAPLAMVVMGTIVAVSFFAHVPVIPLIAFSALAGFAMFLSWRCALVGRESGALIAAGSSIGFALLGVATAIALPLSILIAQGLATSMASFSLCILVDRCLAKMANPSVNKDAAR